MWAENDTEPTRILRHKSTRTARTRNALRSIWYFFESPTIEIWKTVRPLSCVRRSLSADTITVAGNDNGRNVRLAPTRTDGVARTPSRHKSNDVSPAGREGKPNRSPGSYPISSCVFSGIFRFYYFEFWISNFKFWIALGW